MKMKRENVLGVFGIMNVLAEEKTTAKGAYAIAKNKKIAETEVKALQEAQQKVTVPEKFQEYEEKRLDLCEEVADKDEEGKSIKINNGQQFAISPENQDIFNEKLKVLREEYKEAIEAKDKVEKDFFDLLAEEIEIDFHKVKIDDLPDNITASQIEALDEIIIG
jgi:hypothetical protein